MGNQDLFFEVLRKKSHIFCDVKDTATVSELKRIIEGILKVPIGEQILVKFTEEKNYSTFVQLDDKKSFADCGFSAANAKAQAPAQIGLLLKGESAPQIDDLSCPPPMPDAMRTEGAAQE